MLADFNVWIGPSTEATPTTYPVRVYSDAGFAAGQLEVDLHTEDFQTALTRVRSKELNLPLREAFGARLFDALFREDIRDAWVRSKDSAVNGLCLRLTIEPPEVAALPWELLSDGNFLATAADLALCRYLPLGEPPTLAAQEKLCVLLVTASPDELPVIPETEVSALADAIRSAGNKITVDVIRQASRSKIITALQGNQYHIIHYLGHGTSGAVLLHKDNATQMEPIDDRAFSQLVYGRRSLRLVVLSACNSAQAPNGIFTGMAPALIRAHVPAVVANQYEFVQLPTATQFNQVFYHELAQSSPIELAVNRARNAISVGELLKARDWSTPVLYLGTRKSDILRLQKEETGTIDQAWNTVQQAVQESPVTTGALDTLTQRFAELTSLHRKLAQLLTLLDWIRVFADEFTDGVALANKPSLFTPDIQKLVPVWARLNGHHFPRLRSQLAAVSDAATTALCADFLTEAKHLTDLLPTQNFGSIRTSLQTLAHQQSQIESDIRAAVTATVEELRTLSELTLARLT